MADADDFDIEHFRKLLGGQAPAGTTPREERAPARRRKRGAKPAARGASRPAKGRAGTKRR